MPADENQQQQSPAVEKPQQPPEISEEFRRNAPMHKLIAAELQMSDYEADEFYRSLGIEY